MKKQRGHPCFGLGGLHCVKTILQFYRCFRNTSERMASNSGKHSFIGQFVPNSFFTISLDFWNRYYLVVALKSMGTTAGRSPESRAPVPCDNVKVAGKFLDVINVQSLKTYLEF